MNCIWGTLLSEGWFAKEVDDWLVTQKGDLNEGVGLSSLLIT